MRLQQSPRRREYPWRERMARSDHWTDDLVDKAIRLLVLAEAAVKDTEPDLYQQIRLFLLEEA
jgi:hypothetical protein